MSVDAEIDRLLGPFADDAGPELRAALAMKFDSDGRFWPSPRGEVGFVWSRWGLYVTRHDRSAVPNQALGRVIIETLRSLGYWVGGYHYVQRNYKILRRTHRQAARRKIRALIHWYPTGAEVKFYVDGNAENPNGPRYSFHPEASASYLDRKLFEKTRMALSAALTAEGLPDRTETPPADPRQKALWRQITSCHWRPGKGLEMTPGWRHRTGDGIPLHEGMLVQVYGPYGHGGGLWEGRAYYNLNDMWMVATRDRLVQISGYRLWSWKQGRPTRWYSTSDRINRVKSELARAVSAERFEKAAILRDVRDVLRGE